MKPLPSLNALSAFAAVMRHGSVTLAADRLNISQPALSRLVAKCEEDLQTQLFLRERKRLIPTARAHRLLPEVDRILTAHGELGHFATELDEGHLQTMHIAAAPRLAYGLVGSVIQRMMKAGSQCRFSVDSRERSEIERWVSSRRYDIGLASLPVTFDGIRVEPFAEARATILMRRDDPLAGAPGLTIRDISDRSMIVTMPGSLVREHTVSAYAETGRGFNPAIEVANSSLAARYVALGLGLFILDAFAEIGSDETLTSVPLVPGFAQRVAFLLPSDRPVASMVTDFMDTARAISRENGLHPL